MPPRPVACHFQTTHWTLVHKARGSLDTEAREALAALCAAYWYPIYAYIRSSGRSAHDAEDLTQGFFARLLEKDILAAADPAKGKLRTFLLTCVHHHLINEHARATAQRRGGGKIVALDANWAEERYATEPVDDLTPDRLYQRRWVLTILESTLQLLAEEYAADEKGRLFEALRPYLGFTAESAQGYDELAVRLGTSTGAVRTQVSRLRQRWRELLFKQVSITLADPTSDEIRAELAELMSCI